MLLKSTADSLTTRLPESNSSSSSSTARQGTCRSRRVRTSAVHEPAVLNVNRRTALGYLGAGLSVCGPALSQPQAPGLQLPGLPASGSSAAEQCWARYSSLPPGVCYAQQGPLLPLDLPRLEHICTSCFPACVGDKCLLSIEVTYPKGGSLLGLSPPYPLAIFSGGFTVNSAAYRSTAARLASWGYTVVRYNTRDALPDVLDDVTCVRLQRELIDWAATHPLLRRLADTRRVYAAGHSRGAKLAALTAAADPRVAALCLIDPVDVTVYAPLSDRFPSAAAALTAVAQSGRFLPVAVVGSGLAGDCAPRFNNYSAFFTAAPSAAWEVLLPAAGHFQYLDSTTALQRAVCGGGADGPDDAAVRAVSQAALVAWGEAMVKAPGGDVLSSLAARCSGMGMPRGVNSAASSSSSSSGSGSSSVIGGSVLGVSSSGSRDSTDSRPLSPGDVALQRQQQQQPSQQLPWRQQQQLSGLQSMAEAAAAMSSMQAQLPSAGLQELSQTHASSPSSLQQQQQAPQWETVSSAGEQQQQQQLAALPRVQTRQELWLAARAPPPARLRALQADLQRLLVAVSYNSAAALEVRSRFKNFG
uniref:Chlorophyllase n=1 Tax=Tetradesmus obliquus TaxID=3088 RepID=A0A383WQ75_TETOB|eukprot:jgi/Sobl393_1/10086/SZX79422.1